jgi:ATP-binding protein involved in chromosome partitioning
MEYSKTQVLEALKLVKYPENGKDLLELGMIEDIKVTGNRINFSLHFKKQNNPFAGSIRKACELAIRSALGNEVEININIVSDPVTKTTGSNEIISLAGVKNIIAIASGKGGVGKSTVSVNLAVAMAKRGARVGLLDADVYGPSIPKMFSLEGEHPEFKKVGNIDIIIPIEKHGVKLLSLGFLVDPADALIWRGPMATSAIKQMITQSDWGELDYLFIDLPPGTGDIHLTIVQEIPVTGVVIVSTPQQVALADAIKGIAMFTTEKINVPVLGLVENMAWFTPAEYPENKYYIFGKDGCKNLAAEMQIDFLGQIPIVQGICDDGDAGRPSVLDENNPAGHAFIRLAENLVHSLDKRNENFEPTKRVEIEKKSLFRKLKNKKNG